MTMLPAWLQTHWSVKTVTFIRFLSDGAQETHLCIYILPFSRREKLGIMMGNGRVAVWKLVYVEISFQNIELRNLHNAFFILKPETISIQHLTYNSFSIWMISSRRRLFIIGSEFVVWTSYEPKTIKNTLLGLKTHHS